MAHRQDLEALLGPALEALGYELVGVEYLSQGRHALLRIYIDSEHGITLEDCERASHQVSGVLDVEDPIAGSYSLEVSSPGLDRPLFRPEHFARFAGKPVRLRLRLPLEGRRKFAGVIEGVRDGRILIRRDEEPQRLELDPDEIERANLIPEI